MRHYLRSLYSLILRPDDFDARGPDELTLRRGEKIELVEMDDGFGDGWYLGKDTSSGASGLFPGGRIPIGLFPPRRKLMDRPRSVHDRRPQDPHSAPDGV